MMKQLFPSILVLSLALASCLTTPSQSISGSYSTPLLMQPALAGDLAPYTRALRIAHIYHNTSSPDSVPELLNLLNETTKFTGFEADLKTAAGDIFYEIYTGFNRTDVPAEKLINAYSGAFDQVYGKNSQELLEACQSSAYYAYDYAKKDNPLGAVYALSFYRKTMDIRHLLLKGEHHSAHSYVDLEHNYVAVAEIQERLGNFDEAQATIEQAIAYLENKPYNPRCDLLLKLSSIQEHAGELDKSLASANSALASLNSEELNDAVYNIVVGRIANIQELRKNYTEAQRLLEQLLQRAIKDGVGIDPAYRSLADFFVRRNQYQEAIQTYAKLLRLYEKDHPAGYTAEQLRQLIDGLRAKSAQSIQN